MLDCSCGRNTEKYLVLNVLCEYLGSPDSSVLRNANVLFLCASAPFSLSTPRKGVILRGGRGAHQFRTKSLVFLPPLIFRCAIIS